MCSVRALRLVSSGGRIVAGEQRGITGGSSALDLEGMDAGIVAGDEHRPFAALIARVALRESAAILAQLGRGPELRRVK